MVFVAVLPEVSVAMAVMVFVPSDRVRSTSQLVVPVAVMPFTMTDAMAVLSNAIPAIVIVDVVTVAPFVGDVMLSSGGVESVLITSYVHSTSAFAYIQ